MSPLPWTIKLCPCDALQLVIIDANGATVMMAEMYSTEDFRVFAYGLTQIDSGILLDDGVEMMLLDREEIESN